MTRQLLTDMIYMFITLKRMGFTEEFIQLELQECEYISMKKLYRKYCVILKFFYKKYPEYANPLTSL